MHHSSTRRIKSKTTTHKSRAPHKSAKHSNILPHHHHHASHHHHQQQRQAFTTEAKEPKKICDPYGLENKPLDMDSVNMQLEFVLENRWKYDQDKSILTRTFAFSKIPVPPLQSALQGAVIGPRHGPGACFTFTNAIQNVARNNDHYPYDVQITPRKCEVVVNLKTVGRRGVTHADFNLAVQIDSFYNHMDPEKLSNTSAV